MLNIVAPMIVQVGSPCSGLRDRVLNHRRGARSRRLLNACALSGQSRFVSGEGANMERARGPAHALRADWARSACTHAGHSRSTPSGHEQTGSPGTNFGHVCGAQHRLQPQPARTPQARFVARTSAGRKRVLVEPPNLVGVCFVARFGQGDSLDLDEHVRNCRLSCDDSRFWIPNRLRSVCHRGVPRVVVVRLECVPSWLRVVGADGSLFSTSCTRAGTFQS